MQNVHAELPDAHILSKRKFLTDNETAECFVCYLQSREKKLAWPAYSRAFRAHYARYMKKQMTTAQFEQWSRYAVELREQAERDELPQVEYERLLKI